MVCPTATTITITGVPGGGSYTATWDATATGGDCGTAGAWVIPTFGTCTDIRLTCCPVDGTGPNLYWQFWCLSDGTYDLGATYDCSVNPVSFTAGASSFSDSCGIAFSDGFTISAGW